MFVYLLAQNLPAALLIDGDFTFSERPAGRLPMGLPASMGLHSRRWHSVPGMKRGGLFGMAAVLAASANGVDTRPWCAASMSWITCSVRLEPPPPGIKLPQTDLRWHHDHPHRPRAPPKR